KLKHRFLDLRRESMQSKLRLRHHITHVIRDYLNKEGFLEIETPVLTRSTPEGARDYLVPSRTQAGKFFALPQSPQLFKQILMSSGFEKYYQVARCFRDEDLRADRQPEFTQIDLEMSFVEVEDVINLTEGMIEAAFEVAGKTVQAPFPRITYKEAIAKYGSDKPDLRFGLELKDFTSLMKLSSFESFAKIAQKGGLVKGICVPKTGNWSRKEFDDLRNKTVEDFGAKGLAWISYQADDDLGSSPIAKFFKEEELKEIKELAGAKTGDSIFFIADNPSVTHDVLGRLRCHLGEKLNLISKDADKLVWVTDWPLFEKDPLTGAVHFAHHPFTSINPKDSHLADKDSELARAQAYDIVYNGVELGGGSIRNHKVADQQKAFDLLGMKKEEVTEQFGFLMDALSMGAPPHGGIALGLDRLVMMLTAAKSLREVIAFPKVQSASCILTSAPTEVDEKQLRDLSIKVQLPKK
ncbi:MAG TPA: aspartate--tRNA ligase, partial [Vampirovibrionales bacterium]